MDCRAIRNLAEKQPDRLAGLRASRGGPRDFRPGSNPDQWPAEPRLRAGLKSYHAMRWLGLRPGLTVNDGAIRFGVAKGNGLDTAE